MMSQALADAVLMLWGVGTVANGLGFTTAHGFLQARRGEGLKDPFQATMISLLWPAVYAAIVVYYSFYFPFKGAMCLGECVGRRVPATPHPLAALPKPGSEEDRIQREALAEVEAIAPEHPI